jgi:hypothetical protein
MPLTLFKIDVINSNVFTFLRFYVFTFLRFYVFTFLENNDPEVQHLLSIFLVTQPISWHFRVV